MNIDTCQAVCRVVREHVKARYGNPTCIGSIKVLAEVVKELWSIDLTPMTVDIQAIPDDGKRLLMASKGPLFNGHLVGETNGNGEVLLWDPSIDQINEHWGAELVFPFCINQKDMVFDGQSMSFSVRMGCVHLRYRATNHLDAIFSSPAWNTDYSAITAAVLARFSEQYG